MTTRALFLMKGSDSFLDTFLCSLPINLEFICLNSSFANPIFRNILIKISPYRPLDIRKAGKEMTDNEMVEVLQLCHPICRNLRDNITHNLSEREIVLLGKFKQVWEEGLCARPELIKQSGLNLAEIAFLSGYVYYSHRLLSA